MVDPERRRLRSRIEARLLDAGDRDDSATGRFRAEQLPRLSGTVVEIGAGTGVNLRHYAAGTRVIAVEPDPVMRDRLAAAAARLGESIDLDVRTGGGEKLDIDTSSVDAVVSTLVLCGVDEPSRVVDEIRRILVPGGRFVFVEHVIAPAGTRTALAQRVLKRPHRWMFNGCRVDQDTEALLRSVEWRELSVQPVDLGVAAGHVRHHVVGHAIR